MRRRGYPSSCDGRPASTSLRLISSLDRASIEQRAQEVFLGLLAKVSDQKQEVSPNKSPSYAPAKFFKMKEAAGLKKAHLERAMQELLDGDRIHIEVDGPASKRRSRLRIGPTPSQKSDDD